TVFALTDGFAWHWGQAQVPRPGTSPAPATPRKLATSSAIMAAGMFREYSLPQSDSQVMRLAADHEGRVWFGEMGRNYLAVFDPRTQAFQPMTPPQVTCGLMG